MRNIVGLDSDSRVSLPLVGGRNITVNTSDAILLTGPEPKKIKVETFRIDYLIRTPKVEKLSLQPIRLPTTSTPACGQRCRPGRLRNRSHEPAALGLRFPETPISLN